MQKGRYSMTPELSRKYCLSQFVYNHSSVLSACGRNVQKLSGIALERRYHQSYAACAGGSVRQY